MLLVTSRGRCNLLQLNLVFDVVFGFYLVHHQFISPFSSHEIFPLSHLCFELRLSVTQFTS